MLVNKNRKMRMLTYTNIMIFKLLEKKENYNSF